VQLWRARGGQTSASPSLACRRSRAQQKVPSNESKRGVNPTHTEPQPDTAGGKQHRGETAQGGNSTRGNPPANRGQPQRMSRRSTPTLHGQSRNRYSLPPPGLSESGIFWRAPLVNPLDSFGFTYMDTQQPTIPWSSLLIWEKRATTKDVRRSTPTQQPTIPYNHRGSRVNLLTG